MCGQSNNGYIRTVNHRYSIRPGTSFLILLVLLQLLLLLHMATVHQSDAAAANGKSNGRAEAADANGKSNGHGEAADANGKSNGHSKAAAANGKSNGHSEAAAANGKSNGHSEAAAANGKSNGHSEAAAANGESNGHAEAAASNGESNGNGHADATANGKSNGHGEAAANGESNGHGEAAAANGKSNGHGEAAANGESNGHEVEAAVPEEVVKWNFAGAKDGVLAATGANMSIRAIRYKISASVQENGPRPVLPLAHGDPSVFPAFRTAVEAEDAVAAALRTGQFNCYPAGVGLPAARSAVAEHLSQGVPYRLSVDDIFLTAGGTQAIEVIIPVLAQTAGANILLPRPGYPNYEARAAFNKLEVRHFDLIPEKGWEIDLDSLESIADKNTTAMVIINPNNPCGSVYSYEHLAKVAEVAKKLGILVIADEVYGKLVLGSAPFIPMGVFGHTTPVLSIGSLSKSWIVPGWRLGWVAVYDPRKILEETKISASITNYLNVSTDPATFIQAALPQILENTKEDFFKGIIGLLKESSEICYREIKENKYITCPHKPEGSMFVMVKLNLHLLEEIHDDIDFCCKLAKEESVILCPGSVLGMGNWVRITFACVPTSLQDGLGRIKSFCERHKKKNLINGC